MGHAQYTVKDIKNFHLNDPDRISDLYFLYFQTEHAYNSIKTLATAEDFPCHVRSVKIRYNEVKGAIDNLERYWEKIGFNFQPLKETAKKEFNDGLLNPLEKICVGNEGNFN